MYTELLKIAVDEGPQRTAPFPLESVAPTVNLHQRRHRLHVGKGRNSGVSSALSDQSITTLRSSRWPGFSYLDPDRSLFFDVPQKERSRLELALSEKGTA